MLYLVLTVFVVCFVFDYINILEETNVGICLPQITKHYSKPGVVPVDVLPVYPDFEVLILK